MIWLIFTGKIREFLKIPKLFSVFKDDDNGKMFKFMTCSIIFLFIMLFSLGCVAIISTVANPMETVSQATKGAVKGAAAK